MKKRPKILAIIPARAGSKRLPGKNTKSLAGKPLIQWTMEAAKNSKLLAEVIVSTDDESIVELAKKIDIKVPFLRPKHLAQDESTTIDVIKHAIGFFEKQGKHFDYIMLLQPTSPLRTSCHIDEAINLLKDKNADAIISVCPTEHSPLWSNTLDEGGKMDLFISSDIKNTRSQDLPVYYRLNGAIYITKIKRLLDENTMFIKDNIFAYKMTTKSSVDIDECIDFTLAEAIMEKES
jgi:N-acylneuraminate cytidylyltransferase